MKYSMNLLLWGTQVDESLFPVLDLIQEIGFEGVEVPVFNPDPDAWHGWRKRLDEMGLHREADTFCGADANLISPDASVRAQALETLKRNVDCAVVLGAKNLL